MSLVRPETSLLIMFTNLSRFSADCLRRTDVEIATVADDYYERVASEVDCAGGTVVKFIGDSVMAVFPEAVADAGVEMLLNLKDSIDKLMAERGWECRFSAKVHFGTAVAGPFGVPDSKTYDVIGKAVNTAATLESASVTLSVEAFRKLNKDLRKRFKKHSPPITYLRLEDPRPFRWKRGRVYARTR